MLWKYLFHPIKEVSSDELGLFLSICRGTNYLLVAWMQGTLAYHVRNHLTTVLASQNVIYDKAGNKNHHNKYDSAEHRTGDTSA